MTCGPCYGRSKTGSRAQLAVSEVRLFREQNMLRFWPGVFRRSAVALNFAIVSAALAGALRMGNEPYDAELASRRSRAEFAIFVEHRVLAMTPAERRQFEALMKWDVRKSGRPAPENRGNHDGQKDQK